MPPSASRLSPVAVTIDVGLELRAGREPDARLGERLDLVGDDRRAAARDRLEQVAVGHEAQALVPRVVARREVRVDVVARRAAAARDARADQPLHAARGRAAAELEDQPVVSSTFFQRTIG